MRVGSRGAVVSVGAHMVDLSGDWWRAVVDEEAIWVVVRSGKGLGLGGGAGSSSSLKSSSSVRAVRAGAGLVRSVVGGHSGSTKSVCRERSQRTTSERQDGPWPGRVEVAFPVSRRERKAREPREQNV